jgi:hypothetical protein
VIRGYLKNKTKAGPCALPFCVLCYKQLINKIEKIEIRTSSYLLLDEPPQGLGLVACVVHLLRFLSFDFFLTFLFYCDIISQFFEFSFFPWLHYTPEIRENQYPPLTVQGSTLSG